MAQNNLLPYMNFSDGGFGRDIPGGTIPGLEGVKDLKLDSNGNLIIDFPDDNQNKKRVSKYEGNFFMNLKDGYGVMIWNTGGKYSGYF